MKSKQIKISIDNPCGENLKDFERTTNGSICQNCNKEVIDFTQLTERELFNFFEINTQKVCGQFRPDQIGTIKQVRQTNRTKLPLTVATFGILSTLISTESVAAESSIAVTQEVSTQVNDREYSEAPKIKAPVVISGQIIDENDNSGLPGVSIVIKGTKKGTVTDLDGNFELTIKDSKATVVLLISFVGYEEREIELNLNEPNINLGTIKVPLSISILGEVCVVRPWSPKGIWYRLTNIFRK